MAQLSQSVTIYICDTCGTELEIEGAHGLSAPFPTNWLSLSGLGPAGDVFCSWRCLASFAATKADEADARAAARAGS